MALGDVVVVVLGERLGSTILEVPPSPDDSVICYVLVKASTSKEKASGEEFICKASSRVTSWPEQSFGTCTVPHPSEGSSWELPLPVAGLNWECVWQKWAYPPLMDFKTLLVLFFVVVVLVK